MPTLRARIDLGRASVGDVMHRGVITCAPDARLTTVAATMVAHGIHAAALLGPRRGGALVVSDLDLVRAALDGRLEAAAVDVAREPLLAVTADEPLERAVALMATRDESHLLVSDAGGERPLGVLSSLDVMAALGGRDPERARGERPAPAHRPVTAAALEATAVAGVMHPGVVTCLPGDGLEQLAATMADRHIHCVAVVGEADGRFVWGLVTDMDVLHAAHRGTSGAAAELASASPVAVPAGAALEQAARLMADRGTTHLVVVDEAGAPAGVVSTLDVLRIVAAA